MKHKKYEMPMTEVVWLQQQTQLLAGSEVSATISDFQEEEWMPNPTSRPMGFSDDFNGALGF